MRYYTAVFVLVSLMGCGESTGDESDASTNNAIGVPDTGGSADMGSTTIDEGTTVDDLGAAGVPDMEMSSAEDMGGDMQPEADFGPLDDRPSSERQVAVALADTMAGNGYWEYLPPTYQRGESSPLLVFWHGIGENGDGSLAALNQVLSNGPPRYIDRDEWPNERPFVVLSPQHAGGGCPAPAEVADFLAFAISEYDIDESRVYLTGLSCGAIGSWNYLGQNIADTPVAAAVLIAGNGINPVNNTGCQIAQLPLWGFHGDADGTVPVAGTQTAMETLMACPDPKADLRLTIYEGVGHNSWARTYDLSAGHDIYAWMLDQQKL